MPELNTMRRGALDGFHGGSAAARLTAAQRRGVAGRHLDQFLQP